MGMLVLSSFTVEVFYTVAKQKGSSNQQRIYVSNMLIQYH